MAPRYGVTDPDPLALKLVAVDHARGEEFILCLDRSDLEALWAGVRGGSEELSLGRALFDAVVRSMQLLDCADGKPALVAVQAVEAPRTVLNDCVGPSAPPEASESSQGSGRPMGGVDGSASVA